MAAETHVHTFRWITRSQVLEGIKNGADATPFFTEADVRACFAAFDPNNTGKVTTQQYMHALASLGIEAPSNVPSAETKTLDREAFVKQAMTELKLEARR